MADIIVVEDNNEIGELLMDFLVAEGYDTYLASTGEEALEVYEDEGAKLVLLDIMLPGIDGLAVLSRIRELGNAPVIIVSAKNDKEDKLDLVFKFILTDRHGRKYKTINKAASYTFKLSDFVDLTTIKNK